MKTSTRRLPAFLVISIGIVIGIILILLISAPRVEEFLPSANSQGVSSMSRISLRFNRAMNTLTVESRIQIDPALPGKFYWEDQTLIFEPDTPWPADTTVTITLSGGSRGINRIPMIRRRSWSFMVGAPSLVYLWPGDGKSDLYQVAVEPDAEPVRLTNSEIGVLEYSVSVDGASLIYSAYGDGGGTEMHAYDMISKEDHLLFSCEVETPCRAPALSPDGEWLAFERAEFAMGEADRLLPSITRVWLISLSRDQEAAPVSPPDHTANNPDWSPTGWLVYYDDRLKALALMNLNEGLDSSPFNYIPTSLGIVGSWSPDGTQLVYPDIIFPDVEALEEDNSPVGGSPLYFSHLNMVDVTSGRTVDISPGGDWMVEDASPSFSPDGRWVAFTRKFLDSGRWSPGRQVWLMDRARSEIQPLTDEPGTTFSSLTWSPDSRRLAFMRKNVADLSQPSEIWLVDVISGEAVMVVGGGFLPGWIP